MKIRIKKVFLCPITKLIKSKLKINWEKILVSFDHYTEFLSLVMSRIDYALVIKFFVSRRNELVAIMAHFFYTLFNSHY